MADVDTTADISTKTRSTNSLRKTLSSFLFGVIIVRIVNISVRAVATRITNHIDTKKIRKIFNNKNSDDETSNDATNTTTTTTTILNDDASYIVYIEIFILVVILLLTYLYGV